MTTHTSPRTTITNPTTLPLECLATTPPGLEPQLRAELTALGFAISGHIRGGLLFRTDLTGLYRANLWLRTASRVLVRAGYLRANAFWELHKYSRKLPWERFLTPGQPLLFHVTAHKCKLHHTVGIAERIAKGIAERLGQPGTYTTKVEAAAPDAAQITISGWRDRFAISIDSSGELLHRRGYRQAVAKAPLRETLAAGLLLAAGYTGQAPLVDTFCGSGTLPIEAALIARQIAPGLQRASQASFAFTNWPGYDAAGWQSLCDQAAGQMLPQAPQPIFAADRDAGAIAAAGENAARAGVAGDIQFATQSLSDVEPLPVPGLWISNLPYGKRTGGADLRNLFARLGDVARTRFTGWQIAFLVGHRSPLQQTGLEFDAGLALQNGGIPVTFVQSKIEVEEEE